MESALIAALVSIIVVIVSAYASFYGLIITRENKISEMRQAWIDELRKDISDYIAYALEFAFHYSYIRNSQQNNSSELINEHFAKNSHIVDSAYSRIVLRLDRKNHIELLNMLKASYKDYVDMLISDEYSVDMSDHLEKVRDLTVIALDNIWVKINHGEETINKIRKTIPYVAGFIVTVIVIVCRIIYVHAL